MTMTWTFSEECWTSDHPTSRLCGHMVEPQADGSFDALWWADMAWPWISHFIRLGTFPDAQAGMTAIERFADEVKRIECGISPEYDQYTVANSAPIKGIHEAARAFCLANGWTRIPRD